MKKPNERFLLWQDALIVLVSVLVAIGLGRSGLVISLLTKTKEMEVLGSLIAGSFFTSVFTTAPAIVALGQIAHENSILLTALFGAFGAVIGDLVIFRFVRDRLSEHLVDLYSHKNKGLKMRPLFRRRIFRWLTFLVGGLIIASPLPDELGIAVLGFSKISLRRFIPLSYLFNFIGILLIGLVAKAF